MGPTTSGKRNHLKLKVDYPSTTFTINLSRNIVPQHRANGTPLEIESGLPVTTVTINMGDSGSVTITLDLFTVSLLLATLLFGFTSILAKRKYSFLVSRVFASSRKADPL